MSGCLNISASYENSFSLLYIYPFRDPWEKDSFLKLHRKSEQIASCLRFPLGLFHSVITSLSWKCDLPSAQFTYSLYQTGSLSPQVLLLPYIFATGEWELFEMNKQTNKQTKQDIVSTKCLDKIYFMNANVKFKAITI